MDKHGMLPESQRSKISGAFEEGNLPKKTLLSGEYDVKMKEDTIQCFVKDICVLENGHIVIVDSSNYKLKLLDTEFKVIGSFQFQGQPRDICNTGLSEVACMVYAGNGDHSFLQFLSISETTFLPMNSFTVEKESIYGGKMCYLQRYMFVLCSRQEIKVYDRTGSILRSIFCSDLKGSTVMANIWTDGSDLIVTDGMKRIFVLDTNGNRKFKITDKRFEGIYGMCARKCGQIVFTSYYSHSIFTSATNRRNKQEILGQSDGIKHPQAVAFIKQSNSIVIGSYGTDNIQVYTVL